MSHKKFWKWQNLADSPDRTLVLNGTIAEESWFDDDVTPKAFEEELMSGNGNVTIWINSPGGDCIAAAQIYNMLTAYKGKVTVKIDGIAASAASVIAMAGDTVMMSPVGMLMIHNPMTIAMGNEAEMQKAIEMLAEVKNSIINAYEIKTGLSRNKISRLMDEETWMNAKKALELGFCDAIIERETETEEGEAKPEDKIEVEAIMFSQKLTACSLQNKISEKWKIEKKQETGRSVKELKDKLNEIKKLI